MLHVTTVLSLLFIFTEEISAVTFSSISSSINITAGENYTLKWNVSDLTNGTLGWKIGSDYVANVTVVIGRNSTLSGEKMMNTTKYDATFQLVDSNSIIQTSLTIKNIASELNGKEVILTMAGNASSPVELNILGMMTTMTMTDLELNVTTTTAKSTTVTTNVPSSDVTTVTSTGATTASPSSVNCEQPNNTATVDCTTENCRGNRTRTDSATKKHMNRTCIAPIVCNNLGEWQEGNETCGEYFCGVYGMWGENCTRVCGGGCPVANNRTVSRSCDSKTGACKDPSSGNIVTVCEPGFRGTLCNESICSQGCGGGVCLAKDYCGNCPKHFQSGTTCRNIKLDGFIRGSIPTLAVLAIIVILLTIASKWYIRRKIKEN